MDGTPEPGVKYRRSGAVATITLNRPEKLNTIRQEMALGIEACLRAANRDSNVKVIVLEGAGDSFCAGFDFSDGLRHHQVFQEEGYDPGMDVYASANAYVGRIPIYMGMWRGLKPTIAKVHGWCLGAGSEMALCADLVVASHDARFGTPYARVWDCHLSGMWIYRLGLAKAKYYALTGDWVSGKQAAEMALINFSYPLEELDERVTALAEKLAGVPATQLAAMKLIVNQAYDNKGLQGTQLLGPIIDSIMRNTPEGLEFVRVAAIEGVNAAVARRDGPFGDYSQAPAEDKPRRRSALRREQRRSR